MAHIQMDYAIYSLTDLKSQARSLNISGHGTYTDLKSLETKCPQEVYDRIKGDLDPILATLSEFIATAQELGHGQRC